MKINKDYIFVFALFLFKLTVVLCEFKRICYYSNWSQFRLKGAEFYPEDIDPELCSHVIYSFAKIENYDLAPTEESDIAIDDGPGLFQRIMALKLINPSLKILLAVGGWAQGSYSFDTVVASDDKMHLFASNALKFLRKWNFDGLDVDWEFPVVRKLEFTRLLEALRIEFDSEMSSKFQPLLLSMAVSAGQATIDTSYEIKKISHLVDFVNLMAYDLHGSWEMKTGFHSALYSGKSDLMWEKTLNADWAVNYWIDNGCPREKLILGLAFYGRGYNLKSIGTNEVGAPSKGPSKAGKFSKEAGFVSYFEICELIKTKNLVEKFDEEYKVPSIVTDTDWIGYENKKSLEIKANYVKEKCLGGFMLWTVDFDDFKGTFCGQGKYPLLHALNNILKNSKCLNVVSLTENGETGPENSSTTPTNIIFTNQVKPLSNATIPAKIENNSTIEIKKEGPGCCHGNEIISSPLGCQYFQVCLKGFSDPIATLSCPESFWFDKISKTCVLNKPANCMEFNTIEPLKNNLLMSNSLKDNMNIPNIDSILFECPEPSGIFPNTEDCTKFWQCANDMPFERECPPSLVYNDAIKGCGWSSRLCSKLYRLRKLALESGTTFKLSFSCPKSNGLFKNSGDCNSYWECVNYRSIFKVCPGNLVFNEEAGKCGSFSC